MIMISDNDNDMMLYECIWALDKWILLKKNEKKRRNLQELGFTTDHFALWHGRNFVYYELTFLHYGWASGFTTDESPLPSTSPERYLGKSVMQLRHRR